MTPKERNNHVENLFLLSIIQYPDYLNQFINILTEDDFENVAHKLIFNTIKSYHTQHHSAPMMDSFLMELYKLYDKNQLHANIIGQIDEFVVSAFIDCHKPDKKYNRKEFVDLVTERRKDNLANKIRQSQWNPDEYQREISKINSLGKLEEETSIFDVLDEWNEKRTHLRNVKHIRTGIQAFDNCTMGGPLPGEYIMWLGPAKSGKSLLAQNLTFNALLHDSKIYGLHVSTENNKFTIADRYSATFLEKPLHEIYVDSERCQLEPNEYVKQKLIQKFGEDIRNRFHIVTLRGTEALVSNVVAQLERIKQLGIEFNFMIIDDIDSFTGNETYNPKLNREQMLNEVSEAFLDIALRYNLVIHCMGQLKPESNKDKNAGIGSAGSSSRRAKEQIPSCIFINKQTKDEHENNEMGYGISRLENIGARNFAEMPGEVILYQDRAKQRIYTQDTFNYIDKDISNYF